MIEYKIDNTEISGKNLHLLNSQNKYLLYINKDMILSKKQQNGTFTPYVNTCVEYIVRNKMLNFQFPLCE